MNVAKEISRVPWECVTGGGVGRHLEVEWS